jgi:hypothetical protein
MKRIKTGWTVLGRTMAHGLRRWVGPLAKTAWSARPRRRPRCSSGGDIRIRGARGAHQARRGGAGLTRAAQRCEVAGRFNGCDVSVGGYFPGGNDGGGEVLQPKR